MIKKICLILTLLFILLSACDSSCFWEEYFANSYWEINTDFNLGTWDAVNSEWDSETDSGVEVLELKDIGTWTNKYKPDKIRITFTGATEVTFFLIDSDGNIIANKGALGHYIYTSGEEIELRLVGYNIDRLQLLGANVYSVTKIEFFSVANRLLWLWLILFDG